MDKFYEIYSNDIIKRINKFYYYYRWISNINYSLSFGIGIIIEFNGCFRRVKNVLYLDFFSII